MGQPHMERDLVAILACPDDKASLELDATEGDDRIVTTGTLTCTQCGFAYPIEEGIPNLLPSVMHVDEVNDPA